MYFVGIVFVIVTITYDAIAQRQRIVVNVKKRSKRKKKFAPCIWRRGNAQEIKHIDDVCVCVGDE